MRAVAGDGVMLEPQTTAHAEAMFVVLSDPALYAYENAPPPSLDWLRERVARGRGPLLANLVFNAGATGWAGSEPACSMTHDPPRFGNIARPYVDGALLPTRKVSTLAAYAAAWIISETSLRRLRDVSDISELRRWTA